MRCIFLWGVPKNRDLSLYLIIIWSVGLLLGESLVKRRLQQQYPPPRMKEQSHCAWIRLLCFSSFSFLCERCALSSIQKNKCISLLITILLCNWTNVKRFKQNFRSKDFFTLYPLPHFISNRLPKTALVEGQSDVVALFILPHWNKADLMVILTVWNG